MDSKVLPSTGPPPLCVWRLVRYLFCCVLFDLCVVKYKWDRFCVCVCTYCSFYRVLVGTEVGVFYIGAFI